MDKRELDALIERVEGLDGELSPKEQARRDVSEVSAQCEHGLKTLVLATLRALGRDG